MKNFKKIFIASVISLSILSTSLVLGQGWGNQNGNRGPRYMQQQQVNPGPGRVLRAEMYEARVSVLADLTGQAADDIKAKIQLKPMWAVLDEYKVDYKTFQTKMHEKAKGVVTQALNDGKITQEQADFMLERMANGPKGPRYGMRKGGRGFGKGRGGCGRGQGPANWQTQPQY